MYIHITTAQDLHPDKNWSLYERLTRKPECSVDQEKVESDGKPAEMMAALIGSVVANASLMVHQGGNSIG